MVEGQARLKSHPRHAELVSASMLRSAPSAREARWTLNQVQGDEGEGGLRGGGIVAVGTPEQVVKEPRSFTGSILRLV